jgi:His-Xaa-Ser system protein HxsD
MLNKNIIKDDGLLVFVDATLFSKDAIFKCLYWYGDKFHTSVAFTDSNTYCISLNVLTNTSFNKEELELYCQKLERDLIDFQLRETIGKETKNIRDLLVAKAFSNGEFDETPPGDISDPVGFNPISAKNE